MSDWGPAVNPTPDPASAQHALRDFLGRIGSDDRVVGLHDVAGVFFG